VSALTRCRAQWCTGHQSIRCAGVCGGLSRQLHWSEVVLLVGILYRYITIEVSVSSSELGDRWDECTVVCPEDYVGFRAERSKVLGSFL